MGFEVFILIVFLLFRVGQNGDILPWGEGPGAGARAEDELVVGTFTSSGYLFIVLVLMAGAACGDRGKYVMLLFNLCGFLLYIAIGSSQIATYRSERRPLVMKTHTIYSMGAMAILTSLLFLFDTTLSIMDIISK